MNFLHSATSGDAPYLSALNPAQREAVETTEGPLLVLAGAGTGKTRVLTTRLGHILATRRAWPSQILAVTFTNKAAAEMKKRVADMLGGAPVEGWWMGTFHALAARMLRRHAELAGLKQNFSILDDDDQLRLLKQIAEDMGLDAKKNPPRLLLAVIQRWKDRALPPSAISAADAGDVADGRMPRIYAAYQERLKTLNACDFGDLLMHVVTILRDPSNAALLEEWRNRFKYILVDEYQDTNAAQYAWLRLLSRPDGNICCVGDDDQSIYGWRGAEIGNILRFDKDFLNAKIVRLEQNYRSTKHILAAANGVIAHNAGRLGKNLWSADEDGEKVSVRGVWDGPQEARAVAEEVERLQRRGTPLSEIAVLVRASHQTREFEEKFLRESIPYRVIGGLRFYERQEIRDAIAYLRVVAQPDDDLAFDRIVNLPKRGLGDAALQPIRAHARAKGLSLYAALLQVLETDELKPKPRETLKNLTAQFARWRAALNDLSHVEVTQMVLDDSGYLAMWQADKSPEASGRLENLKEFVSALREFDTLEAFLEHVALVMERQEDASTPMVSVMTLHGAKGLEFHHVFLPGWEEGLFPNQRSMDETGAAGLEEERRLAYVGLTRARKKAHILFAANRVIYGQWTSCLPSRFIDELPRADVEVMTETGLSAAPGAAPYQRPRTAQHDDFGAAEPALESAGGFAPGDRVFHQKFGYGKVLTAEGDKLDIAFDKAGRKKVIDSFVEKAQ